MTDLAPVGRDKPAAELTVDDLPTYPPTLWGLLEQRAEATPDRVLLEDDTGRTMTAAQWRDTAEQVAAALYARGITAETPVSWQLPTTHEAAVLLLALARLGAVENPIIPILRQREVSFIVGSDRCAAVDHPEHLAQFRLCRPGQGCRRHPRVRDVGDRPRRPAPRRSLDTAAAADR